MQIVGHRGASGLVPENTLASFEKALELGVDMIELDVHRCATGELVVIHDETTDRTTGHSGKVSEMSLADLQQLDAGGGQTIPTLKQVLNTIARRVPINIELKGAGTAQPVAKLIKHYCTQGWSPEDFYVSSFDYEQLQDFVTYDTGVRVAMIYHEVPHDYVEQSQLISSYAIHANKNYLQLHPDLISDARQYGLKVYSFTINDIEDAKWAYANELEGIFTDYPNKIREVLV